MTKLFVAAAALAALAQPAAAVTFPSLTTIYVGTGVADSGSASNVGIASVLQCSNVSGPSAQVRILILNSEGFVTGQNSTTIPHGGGRTFSTHFTNHFTEDGSITPGIDFDRGAVNIESTQSGVFCQGFRVDAASISPSGVAIRLVRVNAHPGTEE